MPAGQKWLTNDPVAYWAAWDKEGGQPARFPADGGRDKKGDDWGGGAIGFFAVVLGLCIIAATGYGSLPPPPAKAPLALDLAGPA